MIELDALLPEVYVQAANCPEPTALKCLRDAARDFCRRTRVWRDTDAFEISSPECEGMTTFQDAAIVDIERADLNGCRLTPVTVGWLDDNITGWQDYVEDAGAARYITQLNPNTVTVVPKVEGKLSVRLILMPSRTAELVPDFLVEQYATEIGRGAAGLALLIQGKEWTNPQLGASLLAGFNARADSLKISVAKGQQGARLRTRPSFF